MGSDLLRTETVQDVREATATAQARAAADALRKIAQRFPEESFDRHTPMIVQEGQTGTTEVEEFEEREARRVWRKTAVRGAQIVAVEANPKERAVALDVEDCLLPPPRPKRYHRGNGLSP